MANSRLVAAGIRRITRPIERCLFLIHHPAFKRNGIFLFQFEVLRIRLHPKHSCERFLLSGCGIPRQLEGRGFQLHLEKISDAKNTLLRLLQLVFDTLDIVQL